MITDEEYTRRVLARASHRWYNEKVDIDDLKEVMSTFTEVGNDLDAIKKSLMYGRDLIIYGSGSVLPVEKPTPVVPEKDQRIIHAILGIATEGVELIEAVLAYFFEGKPFDAVNLQEEAGDVAWYRAFLLHELGQTHVENIMQNDAKLEKRFGSTFSEQAANERDLEGERKTLEGGDVQDHS